MKQRYVISIIVCIILFVSGGFLVATADVVDDNFYDEYCKDHGYGDYIYTRNSLVNCLKDGEIKYLENIPHENPGIGQVLIGFALGFIAIPIMFWGIEI